MAERSFRLGGRLSFGARKFNKLILSASLLTVLDFLIVFLNSVVVGNLLGMDGLAAMDLVNPLEFLVEFVSAAIGIGTSYLYDQAIGEENEHRAGQIWGQGVILTVAVGALVAGATALMQGRYFTFFDAGETVISQARPYYRLMMIDFFMEPFYYLIYEMVFMDGDEKLSLVTNLAHIPVQIGLTLILCRRMGLAGVALAGIISKVVSIGMFSIHFFRKCNTMKFILYFSFRSVREVLTISLTDAVLNLCWTGTQMVLNKLTLVRFGAEYLPLYTILYSTFELCLFFDGIGEAFAPIANVYIGEKNYKPLNQLFNYSLYFALIEGIAAGIVMFLAAPLFPGIYNVTEPEMAEQVVRSLRILALSFPAISVIFDVSSAYVMTDRVGMATGMVVLAHFAGNVLSALALCGILGFDGITLSYVIAPVLSILVFSLILRKRDPALVKPWLTPLPAENMLCVDGPGTVEGILEMRDEVGEFLKRNGRGDRANSAMVLVEELGMLLAEKNKKKIWLEYTVTVNEDGISLSERDSGEIIDIMEEDSPITRFRDYFIECFLQTVRNKRHTVAIGFNWNTFRM